MTTFHLKKLHIKKVCMFPFHNGNTHPLPDANDIEREILGPQASVNGIYQETSINEERRHRFEADKQKLRNFILGALIIGLLIGGVLAVGLVWAVNRLNLIEPSPTESNPLSASTILPRLNSFQNTSHPSNEY
ncbi:MAG: hypothetical protein F6K42_25880 [Leptolyngbya sp. SIO1D8]|nr:hypothetical protein [Leptolyngbya sp. SIO1D8]